MKETYIPIHSLTEHWHAEKVSYESGDEDATSSKEHLAGVDPFLGPVLDPFVAVSSPSSVFIHQGLLCAIKSRLRLYSCRLSCETFCHQRLLQGCIQGSSEPF